MLRLDLTSPDRAAVPPEVEEHRCVAGRSCHRCRTRVRGKVAARAGFQSAGIDGRWWNVLEQRVDLRNRVESLESFNRNVAHDLRGPLVNIAGGARMARESLGRGDMPMAERLLELAVGQTEGLIQLVSELMALAEANDARLVEETVELSDVAQCAAEQVQAAAGDAARNVDIDIQPLPTVLGVRTLLKQVFVNLLSNAVKFTRDAAQPRIEIGAVVDATATVLYVRDNGVGFGSAQADLLFVPFQRLHGKGYAGHGVGLSLVKRVVERHGGRVWAHSDPSNGATFYFTIPSASVVRTPQALPN